MDAPTAVITAPSVVITVSNWVPIVSILLQFLVVPLVSMIMRSSRKTQDDVGTIKMHLATLNGRVGRVEQWKDDHQTQCAERAAETREAIRELRAKE